MKNSAPKIASRRALISLNSDYFSWTEHEREIFRAIKDELAIQKIKSSLLKSLFKINCDVESVDELWDELSSEELNIVNPCMLLTDGVGEDYIFVNEDFAENTTILDFETVYDYDFNAHEFQQQDRKKVHSDYKPKDYYPFKWEPWIRLFIDNVFFYATLTSVASQVCTELEAYSDTYIDQLIPNELVEGKEHNQASEHGFIWDMKINASGLEGQLNELKTRREEYLEERWLTISQYQAKLAPVIYITDDNSEKIPNRTFIFNNERAIKKVRWRSFIADSTPLIKDYSTIKKLIDDELQKSKEYLDTHYQDIMDNFDPKVVKFKKKMKIVTPTEGFFD